MSINSLSRHQTPHRAKYNSSEEYKKVNYTVQMVSVLIYNAPHRDKRENFKKKTSFFNNLLFDKM